MNFMVIDGMKPYDGRYEFDLRTRELTTREWGWVKRLAGYLPATMQAGFEGDDPELYAVFAVMALHRAGRIAADEAPAIYARLQDLPYGAATVDSDGVGDEDEGDDAGPPALSSPWSATSSGEDSKTSSETSRNGQSNSGSHDLASSPSVLTTSET
jgi:hypothetical protein